MRTRDKRIEHLEAQYQRSFNDMDIIEAWNEEKSYLNGIVEQRRKDNRYILNKAALQKEMQQATVTAFEKCAKQLTDEVGADLATALQNNLLNGGSRRSISSSIGRGIGQIIVDAPQAAINALMKDK